MTVETDHPASRDERARRRIEGLDSIRFVCALWVYFGHGGAPSLSATIGRDTWPGLIGRGIYNNMWSGPAAVIVFFVISGFCIHYPFVSSQGRFSISAFYSRRFIRLLIPLAAAVPLSALLGIRLDLFQRTILWSLLAELVYYALYPLLRTGLLRTRSRLPILSVAFLAAYAVVLTDPRAGDYPSYGTLLNWVLGLPCWLSGCFLAERVWKGEIPSVTRGELWSWRAGVFASAWTCSALRFHSRFGYPWTLNLFALLVAAWLAREIGFRRSSAPSRILEWAGLWSYSLYLVHPAASELFKRIVPEFMVWWSVKPLMWLFVMVAAYVFFILVERPGHKLARAVSEAL